MTDGTNKSVLIPGISADKFLQSSSLPLWKMGNLVTHF
jgi:hypothetical protein